MNPFTKDVDKRLLPIMQQDLALSQNQQQNQANSANAFGGSRQGIQQGVTQAQGALGMGQMAAGLNQANFTQAQAAASGDIANRLKADQGNQSAAQSKDQQRYSGLARPDRIGRRAAEGQPCRELRHADFGGARSSSSWRSSGLIPRSPSSRRRGAIRSSSSGRSRARSA